VRLTDFGGSGDLLVLGPSLGTSVSAVWGPAAALLTKRFHVVGWDLPGHGASEPADKVEVGALADELLALLDGPFHLAGVSMGGVVGLQLLLSAPERVTTATLLCTGAKIGEPVGWHERADLVRREGLGAVRDGSRERWFAPDNRTSPVADALVDGLADVDATSYAAVCEALADHDLRSALADVTAPVLAVAGAHDPVTTPAVLRHLATGVQHGELVVLPDAGHLAPAEAPSEVAALITRQASATAVGTSTARVRAEGMRVRREVLGDTHVDRATAGTDDLTADFQELITRYAWGSIWTRPGLDRRSRSLITLTALVARSHHEELAMHLRAARTNGVTEREIVELLLQTAIYCGVPDANSAFRVAQRVFREEQA
jgi:3-oxoadipate enol-lactonase/4-carboxymuconolactone decarboxylase